MSNKGHPFKLIEPPVAPVNTSQPDAEKTGAASLTVNQIKNRQIVINNNGLRKIAIVKPQEIDICTESQDGFGNKFLSVRATLTKDEFRIL